MIKTWKVLLQVVQHERLIESEKRAELRRAASRREEALTRLDFKALAEFVGPIDEAAVVADLRRQK
jgi:hypothetical protein